MDPQVLLIITMLALGKACAHKQWFGGKTAGALHAYVLNIALPALILSVIPKLTFAAEHLWLVAIPWILLLPAVAAAFFINRLLRGSRQTLGALLLCLPLGNTAYLGYPMVEALVGPQALGLAVIYDQFGSFIMLSTYALLVSTAMGGGEPLTPQRFVRRLLRFPPLLALAIALASKQFPEWPAPVSAVFALIGATLVPVACLALGMQLRFSLPRQKAAVVACAICVRQLLLPAIALTILWTVHPPSMVVHVAVLQSAMPTMITAAALATKSGFDGEICASMAGLGLLIALIVLPLWFWAIT